MSLPSQLEETRRGSRGAAGRPDARSERIIEGCNTSDSYAGVYSKAFDEMFDAQGAVRGP